MPTNVLGTELKCCCRDPITGFFRDGFCRTGPEDVGLHTVCVEVTREFLDFSVLDGKVSLQRLLLSRAADDAIVSERNLSYYCASSVVVSGTCELSADSGLPPAPISTMSP